MAKSTLRSLKNKNVKMKKFRKPKRKSSNVKKRRFYSKVEKVKVINVVTRVFAVFVSLNI
jgi:hypothetical protein